MNNKLILPVVAACAALSANLTAIGAERPAHPARVVGSAVADAVDKVMPGVVVIRTKETRYRLARDWYYGDLYQIPEHLAGQGSGIILSKEGHVLTNNHVIESADEIEVVLHDGTIHPAKLIGRHAQTDLAVLHIQAEDDRHFTAVEPADSDALRVGEFVVAIGSPFSLHSTVTLGIVSQKGRTFGPMPYVDFIQTDAAINQGNSGGPLIDIDGRMVGINTFIQTAGYDAGSIGIGFAVPANLAVKVARSIIKHGDPQLPWLGIVMQQDTDGVKVMQVTRDAPAAKAGLATGDIMLHIGDRPIRETLDVKRALLRFDVGDTVPVKVQRGAKKLTIDIVPDPMPAFLERSSRRHP